MNTNSKRNKNRSSIQSHPNSSLQTINSKPQMRQKSGSERTMTPEGVYFNGRVMHCTTSLIGCVVQIEVKDGTKYEGVLRTFSPEFELVIDYVTKIESNLIPIAGTNIGNLLASLQANHRVSPTIIFKFPDVVKLNAINVDLDFATNKGHLMTDTEISRFDSRTLNRDKELVPWDGSGDGEDQLTELEDHNGVCDQNGWDPDEMFKTNETMFQLKSTYDPNLRDYTIPLVRGEGQDFEQKQREAEKIASEIEGDSFRTERYAKEDADDEERYSAVVRPNDTAQHNRDRHQRNPRKPNTQNANNYTVNNTSGPPGPRTTRPPPSSGAPMSASSAFHSNKNSNNSYSKQFSNSASANTCPSYQNQTHKPQTYRDEQSGYPLSGQTYSKADNEEPQTGQSTQQPNPSSHQNPLPQRSVNENRRPLAPNKRKEEMTDLKKFSNDFKYMSNADTPKENSRDCKSESHKLNNSGISAKSKSPVSAVDSTPVKDKSEQSVDDQTSDKEVRDVRDLSDKRDKREAADGTSAHSPTAAPEAEIAKKSTLNPMANIFTPRSPMAPLNPSATPPSVASTPSSTVSVPISGQLTHAVQHSLSHSHNQQSPLGMTQSVHQSQPRFQNPLVQIQPQYNVLPPGLTLPLGPNQYLMTNVAAMAPTFQSNPNQQRTYRGKGPQQYTNHNIRHDFTQQSAHVAAAVTGHPVLATAPIGAPQQIPVSYAPQQTAAMVTHQAPPQHMYQHMYPQFHPRMNVLPQHSAAMQMAVPHAVQYDPNQLQHIYATAGTVQLQHLVSQAHQHMTNSGPHASGHSTPQSATPTTPLHGGPAPSPVHHQPNQPPTPTPQQTVMYANVTSPHNPQNPNVGHHTSSGAPYHNIVILPTGQAMASGHHSGGHGAPLHAAHALSHNSGQSNHHSGPPPALLPVQLIASSSAQNALAATFNANAGV